MARRKYKQLSAYSDAAKVHEPEKAPEPPPLTPQDTAAPESAPILRTEPAAEPTPAQPPDETRSNLKIQLEHLRFAKKPLEQRIDELGDLSLLQRQWLRLRPQALDRPDILNHAHQLALSNGIPVDSPQYFALLDQALQYHGAFGGGLVSHPVAQSPQPQEEAPMPEVNKHYEDHDTEPDSVDVSIYSAPPSKGSGVASGGNFEQLPHQVTLSAAERDAARSSGISEIEYAKHKIKLTSMKKAGLIRD